MILQRNYISRNRPYELYKNRVKHILHNNISRFTLVLKILLMKDLLRFTAYALLISVSCYSLSSCNNERNTTTSAVDTLTAGSAKKGKIWDKVNIVQIPLTLEENNMLGPVKTVTYKHYKFVERRGKYEKQLEALGYNVYDEYGHLIDQNEYEPDSTPKWKCIYRYDKNNKPVEWHFKFFENDNEYKTTFVYDANGNNVEQIITNVKPGKSERVLLRYDEMGNEIESVTFDTADVMKTSITCEYDKLGNQTKYTSKSVETDHWFQLTASYDSSGYKTGGSIFMAGAGLSKWKAVNDHKGRIIERKEFDTNGTSTKKIMYRYDTHGNVIEILNYNAAGALDTTVWNSFYQYQYDDMGNIISETSYNVRNGKQVPKNYKESAFSYYR